MTSISQIFCSLLLLLHFLNLLLELGPTFLACTSKLHTTFNNGFLSFLCTGLGLLCSHLHLLLIFFIHLVL
ncbi:hypothetical protein AAHE18_02G136100 [Arachis hypogaea]